MSYEGISCCALAIFIKISKKQKNKVPVLINNFIF